MNLEKSSLDRYFAHFDLYPGLKHERDFRGSEETGNGPL